MNRGLAQVSENFGREGHQLCQAPSRENGWGRFIFFSNNITRKKFFNISSSYVTFIWSILTENTFQRGVYPEQTALVMIYTSLFVRHPPWSWQPWSEGQPHVACSMLSRDMGDSSFRRCERGAERAEEIIGFSSTTGSIGYECTLRLSGRCRKEC